MSDEEKRNMLSVMTGETDEALLSTYLAVSADKVLQRVYPFGAPAGSIVPSKYDVIQVQIAAYLINKRGAEGETSHSENGISRSYEDGDVPPTLLREIVPFASAMGSLGETS